jgi:hypothetical protein
LSLLLIPCCIKPNYNESMRVISIVTIMLLIASGCNPKSNETKPSPPGGSSKLIYPMIIKLSDCFNNTQETLKLSDIADSLSYIRLETKETVLLGNIVYILPIDDGYLISDDTWSLFLFDKNGMFKWKLNNKGIGPTEYVEISGVFGVDNMLREIILPDRKSILIYDFNGQYKRKVSLPFYPQNVFVIPSGQYVFANTNPFETVMARVVDRNGRIVRDYINSNDDRRMDDNGRRLIISRSESKFNINEVLLSNKDTIWKLTGNLDLEVRFIIDARLRENKDRFYHYTSNIISKSLIALYFPFQRKNFLYNFNDKTFYNVNRGASGGLPDDIDFGPNVFPGRGDGRVLINYLNPTTLLSIRSSIRNGSDLFNIVQNMKENDNPLIRIIKLKE